MVLADDRTDADVEFATSLGIQIGRLVLDSDFSNSVARLRATSLVIDAAFGGVREYSVVTGPRITVPTPFRFREAYRTGVDSVLRLFWLEKTLRFGGVPVLDDDTELTFGATPVDLLNPIVMSNLAREAGQLGNFPDLTFGRTNKSRWAQAVKEFIPSLHTVKQVDRETAANGFAELLVDSMRARWRSRIQRGQIDTHFTVHCGDGYQVHVSEKWRYSPVVFGTTTSSPVSGRLANGYYKFEGLKKETLIKDRGTYLVAPHNNAATLKDF